MRPLAAPLALAALLAPHHAAHALYPPKLARTWRSDHRAGPLVQMLSVVRQPEAPPHDVPSGEVSTREEAEAESEEAYWEAFPLARRCVAEALGTAAISFACNGISAALALDVIGASVTVGMTVASLVGAFGAFSGAHFNPAVTIALTAGNKFPKKQVPAYFSSQAIGAILGSFLASCLISLPTNIPIPSFRTELMSTGALIFFCFAIGDATDAGRLANAVKPMLIGLTVIVLSIVYGAGMNPAVSMGIRVATAVLTDWGRAAMQGAWQYAIAPSFGALIGGTMLAFAVGEGEGLYRKMAQIGQHYRRALLRTIKSKRPSDQSFSRSRPQ